MKFHRIPVGMFATNCVIVEDNGEALVVDPGAEAEMIERRLFSLGLRPVRIVLTHGHLDHCLAASTLARNFKIGIAMHADDLLLYRNVKAQAAALFGSDDICGGQVEEPDMLISEGSILKVGNAIGEVICLPGHSPGSIGILFEGSPKTLLCGDTIFMDGVGRTDLWGGDWDKLLCSIKERIFTLPDDTRLITGHGAETTVGREKRWFPY